MRKFLKRLTGFNIDPKISKQLLHRINEEVDNMKKAHIIVAGKTGSGKSTLINALFREKLVDTGVGRPITQGINQITKENVPLVLYDTEGLELSGRSQERMIQRLGQLIDDQRGTEEEIDLVYYCLNSQMNRIEGLEIELIQALARLLPVVLILTQAIGAEVEPFKAYLEDLALPVQQIIPVLSKPYLLEGENYIPTHGLEDLVDVSMSLLQQDSQRAFINAQQPDIELKVTESRRWAHQYIKTAFGIGFTPLPIADSTLLVPMQIGMLAHITSIFGVSLDKSQIISVLAGFGGTGAVTLLGKFTVGQLFKLIPGIGTVGGGVISGSTAGLLTLALAYAYIEVLKHILEAERNGRDLPLKEIQKLMNLNFKEQLKQVDKFVPEAIQRDILPEWLKNFYKDE